MGGLSGVRDEASLRRGPLGGGTWLGRLDRVYDVIYSLGLSSVVHRGCVPEGALARDGTPSCGDLPYAGR